MTLAVPGERNIVLKNANWSAFVLLVTLLASFNSLTILLLPISDTAEQLLRLANISISIILWGDFIYLWRRSSNKGHFLVGQEGWMVLLGTIPFFRVFRILWFQRNLKKSGYTLREFLSRIVIKRNAQGTLLFILFAAIVIFQFAVVSILSFEAASPQSNITTISDAIWWAFSTVTTVGYGDKYPVTNSGRLIAILLMIVGIALFSVITGSLAEWFSVRQQRVSFLDESDGEMSTSEAIAQIKRLLERQESEYEQMMSELRARLGDLESRVE